MAPLSLSVNRFGLKLQLQDLLPSMMELNNVAINSDNSNSNGDLNDGYGASHSNGAV